MPPEGKGKGLGYSMDKNMYIEELADVLAMTIEDELACTSQPDEELLLERIVEDDNINGSRVYNRENAGEALVEYAKTDDFNDFMRWITDCELSETFTCYLAKGDYEKLDVLAEIYNADYHKDEIIKLARDILAKDKEVVTA